MVVARWNGTVIAESDQTQIVEGNHYFPSESVKREHLQPSDTTTVCSWKGTANYYHVVADGKENTDAAWCYASPKPEADQIKGCIAFWKGVEIDGSAGAGAEGTIC